MARASKTALELLELSLIPGSVPAVYNIGLAARRITLADQQRRAVNLVWALVREGRIATGSPIAIIGGGVAGTTAAAYAAMLGVHATVFEQSRDAFTIQEGSSRWVHPNIYEWPYGDLWRDAATHLPCMNWSAGIAGDVIRNLRQQWHEAVKLGNITWQPSTRVVGISGVTDRAILQDAAGASHGEFRCVILAIGFGKEPARADIGSRPYWRDDDLHQRMGDGGTALVSGCGDGGLVDVTRVLLQDYRHEWLSDLAAAAAEDTALVDKLCSIERDAARIPDEETLTAALVALEAPAKVTELINDRLRPGTRVILNGRMSGAFSRGACLLNRFVVAQLMKSDAVQYQPGAVRPSEIAHSGDDLRVEVDGIPFTVQQVVIRHGPGQRPIAAFSNLDKALQPARAFLATYSAGVDRSREPAWGPLPMCAAAAPGMLAASSADAMSYIARETQTAMLQFLVQMGRRPTVDVDSSDGALTLTIARDEVPRVRLRVHFDSDSASIVVSLADGPGAPLVIHCGYPPLTDPRRAVEDITERIRDIVDLGGGWR